MCVRTAGQLWIYGFSPGAILIFFCGALPGGKRVHGTLTYNAGFWNEGGCGKS